MGETGRMVVFLSVVLSVWTGMHAYVLARLWSLPPLSTPWRVWVLGAVGFLWAAYPAGRILMVRGVQGAGTALEAVGAIWLGVLFLLVVALLVADLVTGFGTWWPAAARPGKAIAAAAALLLSVVALIQGVRPAVVSEHMVHLPGLPAEAEGTRVVMLSDLHLGNLLGSRWLGRTAERVRALDPDLVVIAGDLLDAEARTVRHALEALRRLQAPLGVFAVTGNHEFYAGLEDSVALMQEAGFRVLRDSWATVTPGLVVAGVEDLTARRQFGLPGDPLPTALDGTPDGAAVILLSHTPWQVEEAARAGVGLMLSGHTHAGQIWPFSWLVRLQYPFVGGRYRIDEMTLIVGRGTGFWGPPMRLWRPAEIVVVTLIGGH